MKKILCLFVVLLFCISCATAAIETKGKGVDGATCKATYTSGFKSFTDVQLKACGAEGGAGTSNIDPQAAILMNILIQALTAKAMPVVPVMP